MDCETYLIELERVEEIVELSVLGSLVQSNEMLLQSVKRELLLVVDVDLERLQPSKESVDRPECGGKRETHRLHELLAGRSNLL